MRPRSPTVCYLPAGARGTLGLSSVQGPESEGGRHKSPSESKSPRARRADARGQETDVLLRQREGIPSPTYVFCSGIKRLCDPHPHWGGGHPLAQPLMQMLTSLETPSSDTPKGMFFQLLSWASLGPGELTQN